MNRRTLLGLFGASAALGGCANSVMGRTVATAFENSFGSAAAFDPDYPDKLPYASVAVSMKNARRALLVLAKAEADELHWVSSDRGVLVTRNGRLVRTVGLPENLARTDFVGGDFFENDALPRSDPSSARRMVDLLPGNRYGMVVESTLVRAQEERIRIGRHEHDTVRFAEHCVAPQLSWEFTNAYWIDGRGMIWRSIQHVTPGLGPVEIEITKPFRA